jgi:hypothetical protein
MSDEKTFDEKEKEVLSKWKHWKDYIDTLEGKDKSEEALSRAKKSARPLHRGCGHCVRSL